MITKKGEEINSTINQSRKIVTAGFFGVAIYVILLGLFFLIGSDIISFKIIGLLAIVAGIWLFRFYKKYWDENTVKDK